MSFPAIWWLALLLAILLHLWLSQRGTGFENWGNLGAAKQEPIEIVAAPPTSRRKPVVETSRARQQEENSARARFDSEFRNRVKKETQAAQNGRFSEGRHQPKGETRPGEGPGTPGLSMSDLMPYSQNPYNLPDDIVRGNSTALNTDQVAYAGFFNRIAELVYDRWVGYVQDVLGGYRAQGRRLSSMSYVTKLGLILNPQGDILEIKILQSCGLPELDDAAKRAFAETGPFTNPPKELLSPEGVVSLDYTLQVELGGMPFNIHRM